MKAATCGLQKSRFVALEGGLFCNKAARLFYFVKGRILRTTNALFFGALILVGVLVYTFIRLS